MNGKEFVVSLRRHKAARRVQELNAHHCSRDAGDGEKDENREQIENADAFVICREQPGTNGVFAEIIRARKFAFCLDVDLGGGFGVHCGGDDCGSCFPIAFK